MEQELLLSVFNSLPVGVGFFTNDGVLVRCNESFCRIFGADAQMLIERKLNINDNSFVPDEVKQAVRNGKPVQMSFLYDFDKQREGKRFFSTRTRSCYLKCNGNPLYNHGGEIANYVFVFEDITDAVKSEEGLRQSRRKTELAMKAADIMFWEFDSETKLFYSDNEPLNGYDASKPVGIELYLATLHPDDRRRVSEVMERMSNGEDCTFSFDSRVMLPGNSDWQYCTISGAPYERNSARRVAKYVGTRKNNTTLQKKQQFFYKILNSIPLSIHIKDVEDNFRYVFCNEESKRMFGTSEDKSASDVLTEDDAERIQKTDVEVVNTGNPYLGLERITLKDGRIYDTIVRKSIIEDNGKRLLLNTRWDQSLQNELQRRAQLLSITLETMNAYTWFYEPGKDWVTFGEGFDKTGKKLTEVNSVDKFLTLVHPDDRQLFADSLRGTVEESREIWDVEYRIDFDGDGVYQWWESRGMLETGIRNDAPYSYMFGMTLCIDTHKQAELTLLKNKETLDALIRQNELVLNNTNSGLAYISKDYVVQWENISKCSKSLSYEAYKKGELCYVSAHNRTSPCEGCVLQRTFISKQTEQIKFTLDSMHVVEVFATPVFLADGTVDGIVIRVDNVTEREQMIKELQEAKSQAEQSDKLKSAFLANMSHEIRTPLNAIVGFSELMTYTEDEEEKTEYMQIINSNNELLLKLISDILDLSKLEAGSVELKTEKFDFSEHFNNMAVSMKQRLKNPKVTLVAVNPYPCCQVMLDRNRVAQILTNYVTNAIKYTPEGFIEMGYETRDGGIYFYVKDSGIGIADEKKNKVFQRFEKLDEFAQGTGLGLSICKAIAEAMNGDVGFDSVSGEGSVFWAFLPCEVDILSMNKEVEPSSPTYKVVLDKIIPEEKAKRRTILIAEDIQSNFQLVSTILKSDYDLLRAENGREAVEIVRSRPVDLLLMDMKMPVLDGLKATTEIRTFNIELPIIALTAHAFESDRLAALKAGCNEYLVKPIEKAKLMSVLKKYC